MKTALIIMPFVEAKSKNNKYPDLHKDELDTIYDLYQNIMSNLGYKTSRSESPTNITRDIFLRLDSADLVVADLTSLNPNVMYELGVRHAFCKKTIILTQDPSEIPFDIKQYYYIEYKFVNKIDRDNLLNDINRTLKKIDEEKEPHFGPVHTYIGSKLFGIAELEINKAKIYTKSFANEMGHLLTSVSNVISTLPDVFPNVFNKTDNGFQLKEKGGKIPIEVVEYFDRRVRNPIQFVCMSSSSTFYEFVPDKYNTHGDINLFRWFLNTLKQFNAYKDPTNMEYYSLLLNHIQRTLIFICKIGASLNKGELNGRILENKKWFEFWDECKFSTEDVDNGTIDLEKMFTD